MFTLKKLLKMVMTPLVMLYKVLMAPLKLLSKMFNSPMGIMFGIMILVIIMLIIVALKQGGQENFSKLTRYMYMYNPTDKNSSYDTRGDNLAIKKEQEDVGIFYESSLEKNHRNQRLDADFAEMNDNMESPMNDDDNLVKE